MLGQGPDPVGLGGGLDEVGHRPDLGRVERARAPPPGPGAASRGRPSRHPTGAGHDFRPTPCRPSAGPRSGRFAPSHPSILLGETCPDPDSSAAAPRWPWPPSSRQASCASVGGATSSTAAPKPDRRTNRAAAVVQRLPRQARGADRLVLEDRRRLHEQPLLRRRRVPRRRTSRSCAPTTNSLTVAAGDLIGALPAAVGALPRRADHRGDEQDGPGRQQRRQPRVRRGRHELLRMQNGGCRPTATG